MSATPPPARPLALVRFHDPNEALGLAVRLLAGSPPFDGMPFGLSIAGLVDRIDTGHYGFARRGDHAAGFVAWGFATQPVAEAWAFRGRVPQPGEIAPEHPCALVFALRAIDAEVTRFLGARLRDVVFRGRDVAYFIRDYGTGADGARRVRPVRLTRPEPRNKA